MPMTRIGISAPRSWVKSNVSPVLSGSRQAAPSARRERARHQQSVHRVQRGVLVDEHAQRHHRLGLDHLEDVALGRAQVLHVAQRVLDVGEA
jgi:hypothetical protein